MSFAELQDGTQNAVALRSASPNFASAQVTVWTVGMVVSDLELRAPEHLPAKHLQLIFTVCSRLVDFFEKTLNEITLLEVLETRTEFTKFLEARKYRAQTIRTYVASVRRLLDCAEEFGWDAAEELPPSWRGVFRTAKDRQLIKLILFLVWSGRSPSDVTEDDTDRWVEIVIAEGFEYHGAANAKHQLWRLLRDAGLASVIPAALKREVKYGIPLERFPDKLKAEVKDLLKWKQAQYAPGRPKNGKMRPVSAKILQHAFSTLFGFAVNVQGRTDINSIPDLLDQTLLESYVGWSINERAVKGTSLVRVFKTLCPAVHHFPVYKSLDLSWSKAFIDGIPTDGDEEAINMRKARHYVGYQEVEAITSAMRKDRDQAEETHKGDPASIAMHELLIRFLLILAWRQRNLRELRVFGSNPNLFKGPIPRNTGLNTPPWVDQELERNPNAEFWQFAFSKDETKSNVAIHAVLPRKLVDPLEEYLEKYRPKLVQGHDPGTLFVNTHRSALDQTAVSNLVGSVTGKYCGVRVAPHRFRDLLAYEWLRLNPKDYLTLSKILWHKNVDMTIKKYGARFNESSGVCAVDAWLDERAVACV